MWGGVYIHTYVRTYVRTYVGIHMYICMYTYVHMYVYVGVKLCGVQSISEWLSKMANHKWRDVIQAIPTRLTPYRMLLVRNGILLEPHLQ